MLVSPTPTIGRPLPTSALTASTRFLLATRDRNRRLFTCVSLIVQTPENGNYDRDVD
ncbi:hypothetical protein [Rhizobium glycinendophyticum]|uniref:hypothetical protein n=1 Tax=Rhizobium glycinendophyticum TaxID=2589807 RepID=UPI00137582FB|nr:hypothetical protein [Rhizobium glycinendophyticum]